jgi:hypothetical protein
LSSEMKIGATSHAKDRWLDTHIRERRWKVGSRAGLL